MQGFAELEYGMLRYMGAIDDSTLVVTSGNFGFCFCNLCVFSIHAPSMLQSLLIYSSCVKFTIFIY